MAGIQFQGFVILLFFLYVRCQEATTDSQQPHFQNVYPGCKAFQNQPLQECNRTLLLLRPLNPHGSEFSEHSNINTTQLYNCFANSHTITLSAVQVGVLFNGTAPYDTNDGDNETESKEFNSCFLNVSGPSGTFFRVQLKAMANLSGWVDNVTIDIIKDGSRKRIGLNSKTTVTRDNLLSVNIKVPEVIQGFFLLTFQAVPECERQLQVKCVSSQNGYIETPGWNAGHSYVNHADSCVTLHVPSDHVIMISLVSIDLGIDPSSTSGCFDPLRYYTAENCTGSPAKVVCRARDLLPTVVRDARAISFRFTTTSASDSEASGFRLLYSFHKSSEEPQKLSDDGTWNCSVDHYAFFKQHFVCHAENYCSDKKDMVVCPEHDQCGVNVVRFGDSCYQMFRPLAQTTWPESSDSCAQHGGRLAVLKNPLEMGNVQESPAIQGANKGLVIFIGLRMTSSVKTNEMYKETLLWSDGSLVLSLSTFLRQGPDVTRPFCGALRDRHVTLFSCETQRHAAFLCEQKSDRKKNLTAISFDRPTVGGMLRNGTTSCDDGHFTHTLLACDVRASCRAANSEESLICSNEFSPPVPFFTCRSGQERVPYSLVCDIRLDCCDGSDEDFCVFRQCYPGEEFSCRNGRQCVKKELMCNNRNDCTDGSDERNCLDDSTVGSNLQTPPPAVVNFTDEGDFIVWSSTSCPDTHFRCSDGGYCLPVFVRCNGINDCPDHEDERGCDTFQCPEFYRCRGSKICLHRDHLCDGVFHCPQHDDELACDVVCPPKCTCYGFAFICSTPINVTTASFWHEVRYIDVFGLLQSLLYVDLKTFTKLIYLKMTMCIFPDLVNLDIPNLQFLGLGYHCSTIRNLNWLNKFENLVSLNISFSDKHPIFSKDPQLSRIIVLHIYQTFSQILNDSDFLEIFPNVQNFTVTHSSLQKLSKLGFQPLINLRYLDVTYMDPRETILPSVFEGLTKLHAVHTNNYKLCCSAVLPEGMTPENCHAEKDEISSCDALLGADVFRVFLALYAILSLTGNVGTFIYRVFLEKSAALIGYEVFVTHLSVADFLMGVYLAIIGIADLVFMGDYHYKERAWKNSVICKLAGFLSLLSSEVSAFLVCLITLERFLVIRFPLKNLRFNQRFAHTASAAVWFVGLTLAAIPLLPWTSHWQFYSQSGICIPLPITRIVFDGKAYAFGVMIVLNFVLFLFIAAGQVLIYWSIQANTVASVNSDRKARERTIARRLLAVVMTDFLCWFPIGVLGILAKTQVPISGQFNVIIAIFVLPFNSALNPFLYTINIVKERRQSSRKPRTTVKDQHPTQNVTEPQNREEDNSYSKDEAFRLFKSCMEDGLLTPDQVRRRVWNIYEG